MPNALPTRIDMHVHVGVLGDDPAFKEYGGISPHMRNDLTFKIMLLYGKLAADRVSDTALRDALLKTIITSGLDQVVCLALDPVYDTAGQRNLAQTTLWVANEFIIRELMPRAPGRILLGASVHPYDPTFKARVAQYVADGAVLLKWLPSAQQINLADPRVKEALTFLATAKGGRPLPVLLHVGAEYAIKTANPVTTSWDFLSWGFWDRFGNLLRPKHKQWATPDVEGALANLRAGVEAGAEVILAHCGLPYFAGPLFRRWLEHDDFPVVRRLLVATARGQTGRGRFLADVSACVTPFRQGYFGEIRRLPAELLLAGSDFPVPVFELSADLAENARDFAAMMQGELERIVVPQDNLLDVNWRELKHAFGDHPMLHNAAALFGRP